MKIKPVNFVFMTSDRYALRNDLGDRRFCAVELSQAAPEPDLSEIERYLLMLRRAQETPTVRGALQNILDVWPNTNKQPGWSKRWDEALTAGRLALRERS